jgi:hypothetical protein
LRFQIEKPGLPRFEVRPSFTQVGDDTIIGSTEWVDADGARESRYYVLTIRKDKIADMQACASWRQAKRFARRVHS